ncbi:MAG TPA: tetratricopeptide repeat protein, partial [Pirellulales bacterium]|nr:tetratricopeptide repeat protein [Pirellulales bacterium]
ELDPDLLEAHSWLAIVDYDIGLMQQAAWHLQRVAELDPHDPRPHRMMAVIHLGFGSHAIAIEDFQESLRRDPNQVDRQEMLVELAQAQLWMRRFADAARTLSQCDETAEVLAMRADGLFGVGRKADARRLAEAALVIEPRQRLALLVLGRLEFDNLRYQQAVELFSRAAEAAPGDYEIHYSYLMALRAAGHTEQVNQELAVVEELRELRERFDELLARATTEPQNANVRYELGVIADRLEMTEVAQSWFKAAVGLDPQHHLARHELNALRFKNNRPHRGGPASP